jgi:hypothetical protein
MRNFSLLAFGALFAATGVLAVPVPAPALKIVTVTHTETKLYVVGATSTKWVDAPKTTETSTTTTTTKEAETTTTTTTTKKEETTTTTTSKKEEPTTTTTTTVEEKKEEPTPTPAPVPSKIEVPIAVVKVTTTEKVEPVVTPTPPPPPPPPPPVVVTPKPPTNGGWTGEATYYATGLGSCGVTNYDSDYIVAISRIVMDPQTPNGNPNLNPLCGKKAICTRNGANPTEVTVTDTCPECASGDMDLSPAAFQSLGGTVAEGRFKIECAWL